MKTVQIDFTRLCLLFSLMVVSVLDFAQVPFINISTYQKEFSVNICEIDTTINVFTTVSVDEYNDVIFVKKYGVHGGFIEEYQLDFPLSSYHQYVNEVIYNPVSEKIMMSGSLYDGSQNDYYYAILNKDFTVVKFEKFGLPFQDDIMISTWIDNDKIVMAGTIWGSDEIFITAVNNTGDIIKDTIYQTPDAFFGLTGIVFKEDSNEYYALKYPDSLWVIDGSTFQITNRFKTDYLNNLGLNRTINKFNDSLFLADFLQLSFETGETYNQYYFTLLHSPVDTSWTYTLNYPSEILASDKFSLLQGDHIWLVWFSCQYCPNYLYEEAPHNIGITKLNLNGELITELLLGGDVNYSYATIEPSSDGNIFVMAMKYDWEKPENDLDIVIYKLDGDGNILTTINTNEEITSIYCYPNPAHDLINISGYSAEDLNFDIFDMNSRLVQSGKPNLNNNIYIGNLPSGHYFIRVSSSKWKSFQSFDKF